MLPNLYSFTVAQVCEINSRILLASPDVIERNLGGVMRDSATLEWILIEIDGLTDSFERAAVVLQKIATRHPFTQGNKRTAVVLANMILIMDGFEIDVGPEKLNQDVRDMINAEWSVETVYTWLKENSVKIAD